VLQTRAIAGSSGLTETAVAIPDVLLGTGFGQVLALQAVAIAGAFVATAVWRWPSILAIVLAAVAVCSKRVMATPLPWRTARCCCLRRCTCWRPALGLAGSCRFSSWCGRPLALAGSTTRGFSTFAAISVAVLTATALFQGVLLSGGLEGLTGTPYGTMLLLKAALFALLILLAAVNRFRLARWPEQRARRRGVLSLSASRWKPS
jgi:putative copper export protein